MYVQVRIRPQRNDEYRISYFVPNQKTLVFLFNYFTMCHTLLVLIWTTKYNAEQIYLLKISKIIT